jgi:tetratricopeptide (TPR) repeat protein
MRASMPVFWTLFRDEEIGDFSGAIAALTGAAAEGLPYYANKHALDSAADHDLAEARRVTGLIPGSRRGKPNFDGPIAQLLISSYAGDWPDAVQWGAAADATMKATPDRQWEERRDLWPEWAEAMARNGDIAGAKALIAKTPLDCDDCVRKRGRIAAIKHDWAEATRWFAMVSARSPSIPFADTDWGEMLLEKGDTGAAIAKFASANRKGPHFADPLEMWGEALTRSNHSDLALAKFEEAGRYAPNWGRLHLKWGEALFYAGRREDAKSQFATAARLELSPQEKSELAQALARV